METTMYLVFLLHFVVFTSGQWTTTYAGKNEAIRCYTDMNKDADITSLLLDITTPEKIDEFCSRMSSLLKCAADYEHHLTNEENTEYLKKTIGVHNFFINVCPPGSDITRQYKGNAPCFQLIKQHILFCGSDLPDMDSYEMQYDTTARCCALMTHRKCVTNVTSEKCGKEAGDVVEKLLLRYFDSQRKDCGKISSQQCLEDRFSTVTISLTTYHRHGKGNRFSKKPFPTTTTESSKTEWEEDWSLTTVAEPWRKHKGKSSAVGASQSEVVPTLLCLGVTIFQYLLLKFPAEEKS